MTVFSNKDGPYGALDLEDGRGVGETESADAFASAPRG